MSDDLYDEPDLMAGHGIALRTNGMCERPDAVLGYLAMEEPTAGPQGATKGLSRQSVLATVMAIEAEHAYLCRATSW